MKRDAESRAGIRGFAARVIAAFAPLACCLASPAIGEERHSNHARLHFELSHSSDQSKEHNAGRNGWGFDGGAATRGFVSLYVNAGLEHFPAGIRSEIARYPGGGGGMARRAGGGDQTRLIASGGIRLSVPIRATEAFVEVGLGIASMTGRLPYYADLSTGALLIPERPTEQNDGLGEVGFGIRTRRTKGYDGYLGFRSREPLNTSPGPAESFQIRFGILTP